MRTSVIIPTYNRPQDLSELFDSILRQSVMPSEVLVVDDSPTITIREVCRDYEAKFDEVGVRLLYIRNPGKRSLTIARNLGARIAQGDIILFFDSDLVLYPDYLEKIIDTFNAYPKALGVGGFMVLPPFPVDVGYYAGEVLKRLFFLHCHSRNSCEYPEYPISVTKVINCNWLPGANMAFKHSVFSEFHFDEKLIEYSYMEDILFSRSISKKYPNTLFITPYAKCIHKVSGESRTESLKLKRQKRQNRKYVQTKLLGSKGLLLYGWQLLGLLIFRLAKKIRKWEIGVDEPSPFPLSSIILNEAKHS
jgi:glycosyltransferase involved in cell wall biosynthesis